MSQRKCPKTRTSQVGQAGRTNSGRPWLSRLSLLACAVSRGCSDQGCVDGFRRALDLGKELRRFSAHTGSVTFVGFSRMVELTTVE